MPPPNEHTAKASILLGPLHFWHPETCETTSHEGMRFLTQVSRAHRLMKYLPPTNDIFANTLAEAEVR